MYTLDYNKALLGWLNRTELCVLLLLPQYIGKDNLFKVDCNLMDWLKQRGIYLALSTLRNKVNYLAGRGYLIKKGVNIYTLNDEYYEDR